MKELRKIAVVVNSGANYARIKSVLSAINAHPDLMLCLIVGASALLEKFGNVAEIIEKDGFTIDAKIYSVVEGENLTTMAKTTGLAIQELATAWENLKPDVVLTIADRHETLATAISAAYMNIPVAHTQGGEITGSIDESVRHAVTKLSHLHFPATKQAVANLIRMGEREEDVYLTGCPSLDLLMDLPKLTPLPKLGVGPDIDIDKPYLVVLNHPVTTEYEDAKYQTEVILEAVRRCNKQVIWLAPNVGAGSDAMSKALRAFHELNPGLPFHFYRNFSPEYYAALISRADCLVGNSSSAIREGSYLGIPAVNIGTRQNFREKGDNVANCGYDAETIAQLITKQSEYKVFKAINLYGNGASGLAIAHILFTHIFSLQKTLRYLGDI